MPDLDTIHDPIDVAYAEAEAMLADEADRAARRERVLAAVANAGAQEASSAPAAPRPAPAPLWRRGGWLVAACVAGLGLFVAGTLYRPEAPPIMPPLASQPAPAPATPAPAPAQVAVAPPPSVRLPPARSIDPPAPELPRPVVVATEAAPTPRAFPNADVVASKAAAPAPAPAPAPPPAQSAARADTRDLALTSGRREQSIERVPVTISAFTGGQQRDAAGRLPENFEVAPVMSGYGASGRMSAGERLRAAAAAGRTSEVQSLLDRGAPVDSPDATGDTALMKSIRADRRETALVLRQHGASLDHKNQAGESARDVAAKVGDQELNQAIGVEP